MAGGPYSEIRSNCLLQSYRDTICACEANTTYHQVLSCTSTTPSNLPPCPGVPIYSLNLFCALCVDSVEMELWPRLLPLAVPAVVAIAVELELDACGCDGLVSGCFCCFGKYGGGKVLLTACFTGKLPAKQRISDQKSE
jgi:hypothetical protein